MIRSLVCAVAFAAAASPALAVNVARTVEIDAPPATVWAAIGDFCAIASWHPAVEKCEISTQDGKTLRTLTLKDGGVIVERALSPSGRSLGYAYEILESPLPVISYRASLSLAPRGAGTRVIWQGNFKAKDNENAKAEEVVGALYDAGLRGIVERMKTR